MLHVQFHALGSTFLALRLNWGLYDTPEAVRRACHAEDEIGPDGLEIMAIGASLKTSRNYKAPLLLHFSV